MTVPPADGPPGAHSRAGWLQSVRRDRRLERAVGRPTPEAERADTAEFARGLASLTDHARSHGTTRVPDGYRTGDGFPLAAWIAEQRLAHLEHDLPPDRQAVLEAVAGWHWEPRPDWAGWDDRAQ